MKYAASTPTVYPSGAKFGDEIRLLSFSGKIDTQPDAQGQAQPVMYLWLTWEASNYVDLPYTYEVQPIAPLAVKCQREHNGRAIRRCVSDHVLEAR